MRARTNQPPNIVLLIESSRASGRSLLRGISEYARHHGPWAFHWEPGGFANVSRRIDLQQADGIILRDMEGIEEVLRFRIPVIVVGHRRREVPGLSNVITDSRMTARLAAEHLIDCGFREFAFVGYDGTPWSDERRDAFAECLRQAGFSLRLYPPPGTRGESPEPVYEEKATPWAQEQAAIANWLKDLPAPVGIMACNDDRAQNVVEACKVAGLRVPDQVGIIGADNDELVCELADPPLSSVAINFERAGFESARLLHQLLRHPRQSRANNILVEPTHVVPRQSTDLLFIDDLAVSRAVRFIRQNAARLVSVAEVVAAAGLSRRVLEKRFRTAVGRTILSEIRKARVDQISRMLVDTNQSISEIALATGFPGVEHFARYFRQERKTTPLAYRKTFGRLSIPR